MRTLSARHWPGNVRELEDIVERALILTQGKTLDVPASELKPRKAARMVRESTAFAASDGETSCAPFATLILLLRSQQASSE